MNKEKTETPQKMGHLHEEIWLIVVCEEGWWVFKEHHRMGSVI
jgi:hypothetical protein